MKFLDYTGVANIDEIFKRWVEYLIDFHARIEFDPKTLEELKQGLEIKDHLRLSDKVYFNDQCLLHLAVGHEESQVIRPFNHLK